MGQAKAGPLAGIRVLDLSRIIAGPFCTMQLGDLGAEIVKIENPRTGDDARAMRPPEAGGEGHFYLAFNRNKRSVALDVTTPEGAEVLHVLAAVSDVLIENFRPGVMQRLGFGYEAMHKRHPRLVYCSISGYGQDGPLADRPGLDPVLQAETGMMSITGPADGPPMRHPLSIVDISTAFYATTAILAALVHRTETGEGQRVEVALFDSAFSLLSNVGQYYLTSGRAPERLGNEHSATVPVGLYETPSGPFYLAIGNDRLFATLCREVLERPDLLQDPRLVSNSTRLAHRREVNALLAEHFATQPRQHWLDRMREAGIPAGAVRSVPEAVESPEVAGRGMLATVPHPTAGDLRLIRSPLRLSDTPVAEPTAPPTLGQHTDEVLSGLLGLDAVRLAALRKAGVIR
jgi:crotonobetainyl-CoA:carnitine CoA-transferase CaiB-like acyl-CoA transferase